MPPLIVIVGPSGSGKTSLLNALTRRGGFASALEEHETRPFQALFKQDPLFALPNQLDYLLTRATQEQRLRTGKLPGLMDGGLDLDFHGFTRLFLARGWLNPEEFDLCRRFYGFIRSLLPPPESVIALHAAQQIIQARLAGRGRINIASGADADQLEAFMSEWLSSLNPARVLHLDVTSEPEDYSEACEAVLNWLMIDPPQVSPGGTAAS